jgi:hypothetical protein
VELTGLVATLGGPKFRGQYSNDHKPAYVTIVFEARVSGGVPRADGEEVLEPDRFGRDDLGTLELATVAKATLQESG